ncbi:MAG: methionyl-tRNA formyltransferase [Chloroflexi bacterium]|nr:methionyl-tRNA formyltransferase [Chloroflexota bacterium]MDA1240268.1 methionyl-tRNA formyltransferase [Chloroflexota bacterium]
MSPTRVVFFGSPEYAVPSLRACLALPGVEVVAVVTQPDRPRGRSGAPAPTPVKAAALEAGVPLILQPERVRRATTEALARLSPDLGVVAASGHILPNHLLDAFPRRVINVHASLLPRHRGASPVANAILAGDAIAGATIMEVVREVDAGPVIARVETPVGPLDTTGVLTDRIANLGAALLAQVLPQWGASEITSTPQDASLVTHAPKLSRADGLIDWTQDAEEIARRVRAFHPWPLARTTYRDQPFTLHLAWPLTATLNAPPGTVMEGDRSVLTSLLPGRLARAVVACGRGSLALLTVQRPGKRPAEIEEYLNGDRALLGSVLGARLG